MGRTDLRDLPPDAIVVHGGLHKTGSSAIQNTLQAHRDNLAAGGWLYPQAGLVDQACTGHRHRTLMTEARDRGPALAWRALRDEIAGWSGRVLISHENFFSPQVDPAWMAARLPADRPVYLLAYLRHPVDYVESCYREWVRRWQYRHGIRSFYDTRLAYLDVARQRDAWAAAFGADHLVLRPYERTRLAGGSVLGDFVETLGLDVPLPAAAGVANESLSSSQTLVHLVANRLGSPATARRECVSDGVGRPLVPRRIADDGLVREIADRHLHDFRAVLGDTRALNDSTFADLPEDPLFRDTNARRLVEELLIA